jgi:branched-chain amino acid transport system substrate-binding protein
VVEDDVLPALGDYAIGAITSHHYSAAHDSPANLAYVKAYAEAYGTSIRPNFMSVAAYDGMAAIYEVTRKLNGAVDGDKAMAILRGLTLESPRGTIVIDATTRDVVQTVYIRRVEKRNGGLYNIEFDKIDGVRDPGR